LILSCYLRAINIPIKIEPRVPRRQNYAGMSEFQSRLIGTEGFS